MNAPAEPGRTSRRTILFVDVVASVALYADLGDSDARALMAPCMEELHSLIESHGGTVVKSLGDGILAAFDGERIAVDAAHEMLGRAVVHGLQVSVGVHVGEVLVEDHDVFGQAVNTASRLSSLARPSEILVTPDIVECLPAERRRSARRLHNVAIKGLTEPVDLFALGDEGPAATTTITTARDRESVRPVGLVIRVLDRSWHVDPRSTLHLGRDPANEVVVEGSRVSRHHAVIASRRGTFVVADQSVNGTWLGFDDGTTVHLLREEATLYGSGVLSLGVPPDHPLSVSILYQTVAQS